MEALDLTVSVPGFGPVKLDIAYGGMWYAVVPAQAVGLVLHPDNGQAICRLGEMIKTACREQHPVCHPVHTSYTGVDILVFYELGSSEPGYEVDGCTGARGGGVAVGGDGKSGGGMGEGGGNCVATTPTVAPVHGKNAVVMSKVCVRGTGPFTPPSGCGWAWLCACLNVEMPD